VNIEEISRIGASRLERVRVRNALNPMLWMSIALPIVLLPAAWIFRDNPWVVWFLLVLAALPTVTAIVAYMYFMISSPDRLQSEEYQLRQRELRMIYRHGRKPDILATMQEAARVEKAATRTGSGERG
jgi:hypothetical protein